MTFTNITGAGIYMQCCHREVEPGGTFSVPWTSARKDRGLRAAMASGALSWTASADDRDVPESPSVTAADLRRAAAEKAASEAAAEAERLAAVRTKMDLDDAAVKANMANMGHFDVPQVGEYKKKVEAVVREKPVSAADVIADDKPKSLADIVRHNKAVKLGKDSERKRHEEI